MKTEIENKNTNGFNCKVEINKVAAVLWGKGITREAYIDDLGNPTAVTTDFGTKGLTRASIVEITLLKYLIPFLIIALLHNFTWHYDSLLGLASASILFASTYFLKKDYKVFAFGTVFLVEILAMYFNYFKDGFLDLGMVLNYQFQYLIFIYLLNMIFEDIANGKYKKYYKLDGMLFRYLTVVDTTTRTTKKYFFYFLLIVSIFAMVVGGVNATSSYVNKVEHEKYLLSLVEKFNKKENQNKQDAKNIKGKYTKEHIDYLNKQCVEQLAAPLHKQGINGIERYTNIGITKETRYIEVDEKAEDIEDGKVRVHKDNKTIVKKGFVKNSNYYFIHKKKIFKVLDVKVD